MMDKYAVLERIANLEEELMMYDYTESKRYEIDRQIQNLEDWLEDLRAG
jgi:hypothetical protein